MLTKDLLRFRKKGDEILPKLIAPQKKEVRELINDIIAIFTEGVGQSYSELEESRDILPYKDRLLCRGLFKLLSERGKFADAPEDLALNRQLILLRAEELRQEKLFSSISSYQAQVAEEFEKPMALLQEGLYADLPELRTLCAFEAIEPLALGHLYNRKLVASLLLYATNLKVLVPRPDLATKRWLFHAIKFHQLLAEAKVDSDEMVVTLSGPRQLFGKAKGYGALYANILPSLLHLTKFRLEAAISLGSRQYTMRIDDSHGLAKSGEPRSGYLMPETQMVIESFNKESKDWQASAGLDVIGLGPSLYFIPDITLSHKKGKALHIELFHRSHQGGIAEAILAAKKQGMADCYFGLEKILLKKIPSECSEDPFFKKHTFVYKDFPSQKQLENLCRQ